MSIEQECHDSLVTYCQHVMQLDLCPVHLQMLRRFTSPHPYQLIVAPPGSGKSTLVSCLMAWRIGRNQNMRAMLRISAVQDLAKDFLGSIAATLEGSGESGYRYQQVFPHIKPVKGRWQRESFTVERTGSAKSWPDPTAMAAGVGGSIVGRRSTGIYVDDLWDLNRPVTQGQTEAEEAWMNTVVLPRLTPDTETPGLVEMDRMAQIVWVGTRSAPEDLMGRIIRGAGGQPAARLVWTNGDIGTETEIVEYTPDAQPDDLPNADHLPQRSGDAMQKLIDLGRPTEGTKWTW